MSGLAGQSIGLGDQSPTPIGGDAAVDAESRGSMENFIGFGLDATSYDPAPVDFDADDDTVTSASDGSTRVAPEYVGNELSWASLSAYLGNVATRCNMPTQYSGPGLTQGMGRKYHFARDDISSLKLIFCNWTGIEIPTGTDITINASIEYPAGVFTEVLFDGLSIGVIPSGGLLESDFTNIEIPNGAKFFTRSFQESPGGVIYFDDGKGDVANGDAYEYAASGLTNKTMSGTVNDMSSFWCNGPVAIVGMTKTSTIGLIGDSRCFGFMDRPTGTSGDIGEAARSVGPLCGYINAGVSGTEAQYYMAQNTQRNKLLAYCSHIVCALGINDSNSGVAALTTYARLENIRQLYGKPFYQLTLPPRTNSTDSWATLDNQSISANNSIREELNALIVANSNGFDGVFDIIPPICTINSTGVLAWNVGNTPDGLHDTNTSNIDLQNSGIIDPTVFVRG